MATTPGVKKKAAARASDRAREVARNEPALERLARVESVIREWGRAADERAALNAETISKPVPAFRRPMPRITFTARDVRVIDGIDKAEEQLRNAKQELARGNTHGAAWHLDRAEAIYAMSRVNLFNAPQVMRDASAGHTLARGREKGGKRAAATNRAKAAPNDARILKAAQTLLQSNPRLSNAELGRRLSERGLGGRHAIARKLGTLLKR